MKQSLEGTQEYLDSLESSGEVRDGVIAGTAGLLSVGDGDTFDVELRDEAGLEVKTTVRVDKGALADFPASHDGPFARFVRAHEGATIDYRFARKKL